MLAGAAVYVIGFGKTIRGAISADEWDAYRTFWRAFFSKEDGTVCWFAANNLPLVIGADASRQIDPKYFRPDCKSTAESA